MLMTRIFLLVGLGLYVCSSDMCLFAMKRYQDAQRLFSDSDTEDIESVVTHVSPTPERDEIESVTSDSKKNESIESCDSTQEAIDDLRTAKSPLLCIPQSITFKTSVCDRATQTDELEEGYVLELLNKLYKQRQKRLRGE